MKRLILLEWVELAKDLRSWLVALLPALLYSAGRTLDLSSGGVPLGAFHEFFGFAATALVLESALIVDGFAYQRDRGELELLLLLPLSPARLLAAKCAAVFLPTLLLALLQCLWALRLLAGIPEFDPASALLGTGTAAALFAALASWGARLALSGATLRNAAAKLLLLLLLFVGAVQTSSLLLPAGLLWTVPAALLALAAVGFLLLARRWTRPETWLVR